MSEQRAEPRTVVDDAHERISSRRVEGTPVYNRKDERLGAIHSVMIEKKSGKVAYAVLSFGGLLGMKEHVHPVPWEMLTYDVDMDAYLVDWTRDQRNDVTTLGLDYADRTHAHPPAGAVSGVS